MRYFHKIGLLHAEDIDDLQEQYMDLAKQIDESYPEIAHVWDWSPLAIWRKLRWNSDKSWMYQFGDGDKRKYLKIDVNFWRFGIGIDLRSSEPTIQILWMKISLDHVPF